MKLRYQLDYTLCDNDICKKHKKCWRFQALLRLQEDKIEKQISISRFSDTLCDDFIPDEYGQPFGLNRVWKDPRK